MNAPLTVAEAKVNLAGALLNYELANDAWWMADRKYGNWQASEITNGLLEVMQMRDKRKATDKAAYYAAIDRQAAVNAAAKDDKLETEELAKAATGARDENDQHADVQ